MPDVPPPTMVAWVSALSRQGSLYWVPVSLPRIDQIADEARYRKPDGVIPKGGYDRKTRYVEADALAVQPKRGPGRPPRQR